MEERAKETNKDLLLSHFSTLPLSVPPALHDLIIPLFHPSNLSFPVMRLLFVCMGNICRSPAAEGVMRAKLEAAGLDKQVAVDSAGTIDFHAGKLPDRRMILAASNRGLNLEHRARQVRIKDLDDFDIIIVMDGENLAYVRSLDRAGQCAAKLKSFCDFCTRHPCDEVPDPYLGGASDFELVLDILDDGCAEILRRLQSGTLLAA